MPNLFHDIADLKSVLGGAVAADKGILLSVTPFLEDAILTYIQPYLGEALTQQLCENYGKSESESERELTDLIKIAVANFGLYHYLQVGDVTVTERGRVKSENASFKYQNLAQENELQRQGYEAIERALMYLESEKGRGAEELNHWQNSIACAWHRQSFLRYAWQAKRFYNYNISRWVFESLRPVISDVETDILGYMFPPDFTNYLKSKVDNESNCLSPAEQVLLTMLYKAIAAFSYAEGYKRQMVQLKTNSVVQFEVQDSSTMHRQQIAQPQFVDAAIDHANIWANRYTKLIRQHIESNRAKFPLIYHTSVGGTNDTDLGWGYIAEEGDEPIRASIKGFCIL